MPLYKIIKRQPKINRKLLYSLLSILVAIITLVSNNQQAIDQYIEVGNDAGNEIGPVIDFSLGEVIFTNPILQSNQLEIKLLSLINQAEQSIDIAIYNLSVESITNALIDAKNRGVLVRVVVDEGAMTFRSGDDNYYIGNLIGNGIEIEVVYSGGIMHHKFAIFDASILWTGSANFTKNGLKSDNNNVIVLDDYKIIQAYQNEFELLWSGTKDNYATENTTSQVVIEAVFSSSGMAQKKIIEVIQSAESEILVMAYAFTDDDIANAMVSMNNYGVSLQGVFEYQGGGSEYSEFEKLYCATSMFRTDGNQNLMHHKVIIIDQEIVITGSYNFSNNANRNNSENLLIIRDKEVANYYLNEFEKIWNLGQVVNPNWYSCN